MHPEVVATVIVASGLSFAHSHRIVPKRTIELTYLGAIAAQEAFDATITGLPNFIAVLNSWTRSERVAFLVNLFMVDEKHETSWGLASRTIQEAASDFDEIVERIWLQKTSPTDTEA